MWTFEKVGQAGCKTQAAQSNLMEFGWLREQN
jgi:hypothetical protein